MSILLIASPYGCEERGERDGINAESQTRILESGARVQVSGASILSLQEKSDEVEVVLRAQSLDPRVELSSGRCTAHRFYFEFAQLQPLSELDASWRSFLSIRSSTEEAAERLLLSGVELQGDLDDPEYFPLGNEQPLPLRKVAGSRVSWWSMLDYGRLETESTAMVTARPERAVACSYGGGVAERGGENSLLIRHRLRYRSERAYRFAITGDIQGDTRALSQLVEELNAQRQDEDQGPLLFLVLNGDLSLQGEGDELQQIRSVLQRLQLPWFATAGDHDARGEPSTWVRYMGTSSFAFDLGILRLLVLDSGDLRLSESVWRRLDSWLEKTPLWWPSSPSPSLSLVLTHLPPIGSSAESAAFQQELEGARLLRALRGAKTAALIHSSGLGFQEYNQGGLRHFQSGSLTKEGRWLEVMISVECSDTGDEGAALNAPCGLVEGELVSCSSGSVCVNERCQPCWEIKSHTLPPR